MRTGEKISWKWYRIDAVAVVLCVLVTVAVYLVMVQPLAERNAAYAQQQQELEQGQHTVTHLTERLVAQQRQFERVNAALRKIPLRLSDGGSINNRLSDLTDLAHSCQLKINQIQPSRSRPGGRYDIVRVRMVGTGTYSDFAAFLNRLHRRFKDTGVRSFDLSADSKAQRTPASFTLELNWYTTPADDL